MSRQFWTEEEDNIVKEHYPKGGSKLCKNFLNRTNEAIRIRAVKLKLSAPDQKFTISKETADKIINQIKYEGKTLKELVPIYGSFIGGLARSVKDHYPNINFISLSSYHRVNHNYFDIIGPDQAYFIGLILTDGCILEPKTGHNQICLGLQIGDKYILDQFAKELNYKGEVKIYNRKKREFNQQPTARLRFCSEKLVNKLKELGIGPRKSLTVEIPKLFLENEHLFWHFLRGVMDGNGTVSYPKNQGINKKYYNFGISGNSSVCDTLAKFLSEKYSLGTGKVFKSLTSNVSSFQITGNKQMQKLYYLLYKDAKFFLTRKHDKFSQCLIQDGLQPFILVETQPGYQSLQPFGNALTLETQLS